jgi:type II secretory pathway predicted ATPase ExeA
MYESFYGFKEKPFQISPDPNFLYLSPNHNHALQYLEYGIERNIGIILLTGEVGSGKTTLIQYHRRQLGRDLETAVISNTNLSANDLIASVLIELNIQPDAGSKAININLFKAYLESLAAENRRLILVIDEAQNLPREALEEIRMLSNFQADKGLPLQIFLIGQPELRTILKSPGMHQLRQRIAVNYHLNGLDRDDTQKYIEYRLQKAGCTKNLFNAAAVDLIFQTTSGIPRAINILCDSSLLYGFAEEVAAIDAEVVDSVLKDLNLDSFVQKPGHDSAHRPDEPTPSAGPILPNHSAGPQTAHRPDDAVKKALIVLNKKIDRLDIKLDLLRKDMLDIAGALPHAGRVTPEDLKAESAAIRSEYQNLRAALEKLPKRDAAEKRAEHDTKGGVKPVGDGRVYKLEK